VSLDGGATWSSAVDAGGPSGLGPVSCSDAQHCVGLIGSDATNSYGVGTPAVTSDGGSTWTQASTTVGQAVSCLPGFCVSVGGRWQSATNTYPGDAYLSTDGWLSWSPMSVPTTESLTAVTCLSSVDCVAVGGSYPSATTGVILTYQE